MLRQFLPLRVSNLLECKLGSDIVNFVLMPMCYDSIADAILANDFISVKLLCCRYELSHNDVATAIACSNIQIAECVTNEWFILGTHKIQNKHRGWPGPNSAYGCFMLSDIAIKSKYTGAAALTCNGNILIKLLDKIFEIYSNNNDTGMGRRWYRIHIVVPALQHCIEILEPVILKHKLTHLIFPKTKDLKVFMSQIMVFCIKVIENDETFDKLIDILQKQNLLFFSQTLRQLVSAILSSREKYWHAAKILMKKGILRKVSMGHVLRSFYGINDMMHYCTTGDGYNLSLSISFEYAQSILNIMNKSIVLACEHAEDLYQIPRMCKTLFNDFKEILLLIDLLNRALCIDSTSIVQSTTTKCTPLSRKDRKMSVKKYIVQLLNHASAICVLLKTNLNRCCDATKKLVLLLINDMKQAYVMLDHSAKHHGRKYKKVQFVDIEYLLHIDKCKLWSLIDTRHQICQHNMCPKNIPPQKNK